MTALRMLVIAAWVAALAPLDGKQATRVVEWRIDNLESIGGHAVTVVGAPRVVATEIGNAVRFNGTSDGLLIDSNPLAGLSRFTVEVTFKPDADGPEEQRFVHFEEAGTGNRALVELRMSAGRWALDTFLRSPEPGLTLLDRARTHPSDQWHTASVSYDRGTMSHHVNGVREGSGAVAFVPLGSGRASIGMRQNRVSWFKGLIHSIRITPEATQVIPLFPEGVPGARPDVGEERHEAGRIYNVQTPTLTYIPPTASPNGTAVIICPGGGYSRLAMSNEAAGVAALLQERGVATFILKYRLAEFGYPAPIQDVLRAVRLVRARAAEWGVDPNRIGVMGASAGGHLAAAAAIFHDGPEGRTGGPLDTTSARPDFVSLLYPVITMQGPLAHADSRRGLLGEAPRAELVTRMSLEQQVKAGMPPVFLVHSAEDRSVPIDNSIMFHAALRTANVPVEMHLYERGAHGFGTSPDLGPTSRVARSMVRMDGGARLPASSREAADVGSGLRRPA